MPTFVVKTVIALYTSSVPSSRRLAVIFWAMSPPMGSTAPHAPLPPAKLQCLLQLVIRPAGLTSLTSVPNLMSMAL